MQNKKGVAGSSIALWIIAIVFIVGIGFFINFAVRQTGIDEQTPEERAVETGNAPDLVQIKARTIDKETDDTQVSTTLYAWNPKEPTKMLANGKTTSATAGTDTTIDGVVVGDELELTAFSNATYYGGILSGDKGTLSNIKKTITREGETIEVPVHAIMAGGMSIKVYDASSENERYSKACVDADALTNLTLVAGESDDLDAIEIKVNASQKSYYFDSIVFDTPASTNIDDITVSGMDETTEAVKFLKDKQNYRFQPTGGVPVFLREYQKYKTGAVKVKASATDPDDEYVDVYFLDRQQYKSVNGATAGSIQWGVENDKQTEQDIGHHYLESCMTFGVQ